jgi:hypothetical protein
MNRPSIQYMNDDEEYRIDDWRAKINVRYYNAIKRNDIMIHKFVEAMQSWANANEVPLHAVRVEQGPAITATGKLALKFIVDPEYDPDE